MLYSVNPATGQLEFRMAGGSLTVNRLVNGRIAIDFPAKAVSPADLEKALGATAAGGGNSRLDLLVELE
ncbi:hypothetical protein [Nonomuraea sp. NPDC049784]|uniref:hypothetical protein n=1 Tax=Nonomuraea sp. NPDC049784 TaxID=3154361 RepID=UPI0033C77715